MLDTLTVQRADVLRGTASPQPAKPTQWGTLSLDALRRFPVVMADGPTGSSVYWPEWFGVIHPDLATTDAGFNQVDAIWMPMSDIRVKVFVDPLISPPEPLREAVQAIREMSALSASDVAAMIGVKRRHLYNLLGGSRASSDRERWIRSLAKILSALHDAAGADSSRVRSAILQPLAHGRSLFDVASEHNEDAVNQAKAVLERELLAGRLAGCIRRPSPTLRRRGTGSAAGDFLSGYREPNG